MWFPAYVAHQPRWRLFPQSILAGFFLLSVAFFVFCAWGNSQAQVTMITGDGTMGTNVPTGCNACNITGGTRPGNGSNLFHSFDKFNVGATGVANFLNDSGNPTTNILSRVTGSDASNILGKIQTEGFGNANLFLMNPAGIVFGKNATLNVGGGAYFTTADYVRLADGVQFTAMPSAQDVLLSVAPVAAFGFLDTNAGGTISVNGSELSVGDGQTLSLVGEDLTIGNSALSAQGGQIAIASVASPGEVVADTFASAPNVNGELFTMMGTIVLSEGATLNVSGNVDGGDAAGTVIIRGGNLMMTNATISADTGESDGATTAVSMQLAGDLAIETNLDVPTISARSLGDGNAGEVQIESGNMSVMVTSPDPLNVIATGTSGTGKAGNVSITTGGIAFRGDPDGSFSYIDSSTGSDGPGGNINIKADSFFMENGRLLTGTNTDFIFPPMGPSGNVAISADTLELNSASISTETFFSKGGNVTIKGNNIVLKNSPISASGPVQSGGISIDADSVVAIGSRLESFIQGAILGPIDDNRAPSAGISIDANVVELKEGSQLITSTLGLSDAGPIRVNATDYLGILGNLVEIQPSGIFSNALGFEGPGKSGNISITTNLLEMTGGGVINTATQGSGLGGTVTIAAKNVSISGQQEFPPVEPELGLGGILASGIFTSTLGDGTFCSGPCGEAGKIVIETGSLNLSEGGAINSGTRGGGGGGTISVKASNNISIAGVLDDGRPGGVFSQATGPEFGAGDGGAISLVADQNFTLSKGATVSASSDGPGNAGNINITGHDTVLINKATVTTEADQASGGNITLTANEMIQLVDSTISSSVKGDETTGGGNVTLDPDFIILQNSQILAKAVDGQGGNISLIASKAVLLDAQSTLDASSQTGISGSVTIESPIQVLSGTIAPLPDQPVNVATLYASRCVAGEGGHFSTFVDSKSDSVAPTPGTFLASPFLPQVSSSPAGGLGHADPPAGIAETGHAASIQVAIYSTPVLFQHGNGMFSACP
ncbi:two-partner secretion domain-containing protein [Nitrospira sp. T9]|uniref:two-partner secretion domain-containing protein n=1 Tax=unclassified Nitrospira TaxID=2652172 RepID=UPI003F981FCD